VGRDPFHPAESMTGQPPPDGRSQAVRRVMFRPGDIGKFEFVTLAALRTAQLQRGCIPRVLASHKLTTTAQHEVADGKVCGSPKYPRPVVAEGG